ncbi:4Fe-4S binding protein [Methanothermobacter thermautotrophicus]
MPDGCSSRKRKINGTECILCMRCVFSCPAGALHI